MATLMMCVFLGCVVAGGVVLGWLAHARKYGLDDDTNLIDQGDVAAQSGD